MNLTAISLAALLVGAAAQDPCATNPPPAPPPILHECVDGYFDQACLDAAEDEWLAGRQKACREYEESETQVDANLRSAINTCWGLLLKVQQALCISEAQATAEWESEQNWRTLGLAHEANDSDYQSAVIDCCIQPGFSTIAPIWFARIL